jgi:hypothetical protein
MLTLVNRKRRFGAASLLAVLYAFCVLAPAAAFAFGNGEKAAHCLTDTNHGLGKVHAYADGSRHEHGAAHQHHASQDHAAAQENSQANDEGKSHSSTCCGLICLTGLATAVESLWSEATREPLPVVLAANGVRGCGLDRLDRPPRSLPSV